VNVFYADVLEELKHSPFASRQELKSQNTIQDSEKVCFFMTRKIYFIL